MDSGKVSKPQPAASPPLAGTGRLSGHRSRSRSPEVRPESSVSFQYYEHVSTTEELNSDFPEIVSEIFKEDLTYRALARKFLWEFFD